MKSLLSILCLSLLSNAALAHSEDYSCKLIAGGSQDPTSLTQEFKLSLAGVAIELDKGMVLEGIPSGEILKVSLMKVRQTQNPDESFGQALRLEDISEDESSIGFSEGTQSFMGVAKWFSGKYISIGCQRL